MATPTVGPWEASVGYACSGVGSGVEHSTYWAVVNTNRTLDGLPLWATADCRPDPAPPSGDINYPFDPVPNSGANIALYRVATYTDRRLDGLPLMAAEIDPCCDGGIGMPPSLVTLTGPCGQTASVSSVLRMLFTDYDGVHLPGTPGANPIYYFDLTYTGSEPNPYSTLLLDLGNIYFWDGVIDTGCSFGPLHWRISINACEGDVLGDPLFYAKSWIQASATPPTTPNTWWPYQAGMPDVYHLATAPFAWPRAYSPFSTPVYFFTPLKLLNNFLSSGVPTTWCATYIPLIAITQP